MAVVTGYFARFVPPLHDCTSALSNLSSGRSGGGRQQGEGRKKPAQKFAICPHGEKSFCNKK